MQDKDLEEIINEIKAYNGMDDGNKKRRSESLREEQKRVLEAMEEGLLHVHGTPPNTKQQGIIRIMGENCNGFNNRIRGNGKIAKAIDIKDNLD